MTFLLDNLIFIVLALVSGGLLLWPKLAQSGGSTALGILEATQLINHQNAIIVDIRDEKDFAAGSLPAARNIPDAQLAERAAELTRFKSRPVLVVCASGQSSTRAIATFKAQGFAGAYSLAGGINAWKQAALPLVQPGRDNTRTVAREPSRKTKNEQRARAAKNALDATVVEPAETLPAGEGDVAAEPSSAKLV